MTSIDTLASCLVPSIIIVVLNVRIIHKIHEYQTVTLDLPRHLVNPASLAVAALPDAHPLRRRSLVQTSVSASGSMRIKFTSKAAGAGAAGAAGAAYCATAAAAAAGGPLDCAHQLQFGNTPPSHKMRTRPTSRTVSVPAAAAQCLWKHETRPANNAAAAASCPAQGPQPTAKRIVRGHSQFRTVTSRAAWSSSAGVMEGSDVSSGQRACC